MLVVHQINIYVERYFERKILGINVPPHRYATLQNSVDLVGTLFDLRKEQRCLIHVISYKQSEEENQEGNIPHPGLTVLLQIRRDDQHLFSFLVIFIFLIFFNKKILSCAFSFNIC